jgi:hypothetical protein
MELETNLSFQEAKSLTNLPDYIQKEVDILTDALRKCPNIVNRGRAFGLQIALSTTLKEVMLGRHGYDADQIINNIQSLVNKTPST